MSGDEKQSGFPASSEQSEADYQTRKAEILKNSRFTPAVEERLRSDKFNRASPDLPGEPTSSDSWKAEKWRQLIGKNLDPDLFECVTRRLEIEDAKERALEDLSKQRGSYEDFVKTRKGIEQQKSKEFDSLCDLAFQGKDADFFRAVADILDFVREKGIPIFNEWKPDQAGEGEFLCVWKLRADGIPRTCEDRLPSLEELWLLGCRLFKWDKGRWQSGDDSAKMKDRLRKFLDRRGLPYRKMPR
jgi:hypothetical protein